MYLQVSASYVVCLGIVDHRYISYYALDSQQWPQLLNCHVHVIHLWSYIYSLFVGTTKEI